MGMDDGVRIERLGISKMPQWSFFSFRNVSSTNGRPTLCSADNTGISLSAEIHGVSKLSMSGFQARSNLT